MVLKCLVGNKVDIITVVKRQYKLWIFIAFNKIKERRIFYIIYHNLCDTSYIYLISR